MSESGKIFNRGLEEYGATLQAFSDVVRQCHEENSHANDADSDRTPVEDAIACIAINAFIDYMESTRMLNEAAERFHEQIFRFGCILQLIFTVELYFK